VTGLLVPAGKPDAICDSTVRLLIDPALRSRMGDRARRWVMERYDSRRVLGSAVQFYKELLSSKSKINQVPEQVQAAIGLFQ
ncbi:MAG TPA: hypothetical protein VGR96_16620, partial [Acidobacteriaceae bacterium]|nr:hypothetical protein [Acidobacteriaceae bacterium]